LAEPRPTRKSALRGIESGFCYTHYTSRGEKEYLGKKVLSTEGGSRVKLKRKKQFTGLNRNGRRGSSGSIDSEGESS